jgi:hypothetical protein
MLDCALPHQSRLAHQWSSLYLFCHVFGGYGAPLLLPLCFEATPLEAPPLEAPPLEAPPLRASPLEAPPLEDLFLDASACCCEFSVR